MTETVKTEVHHAQNEQDEVQRTPDEAYGVTEMRFLCASQIVIRSTGEIVKITDKMKLVYIYMMNQYLGFRSRGQQFYTDQRQIGAALDISRDTLSKVLASLKTLGIVETAGWKGNSESYTVHFFSDVADGLQVIHKEWKGVPAWDHERANKNFKSKNQKPTNEEKKGDGEQAQQQEHEQQSPGVAPVPATNDSEQQSGVSQPAGDSSDDVPANDAVNHDDITIFDENGVVTEEFINALSGDAAPNRNDDGTLKKYGFAYAMARAYQAHREGKSDEEIQGCMQNWMKEARPEHIPAHLLPKEHRAEPKPEPMCDLSEEDLPF